MKRLPRLLLSLALPLMIGTNAVAADSRIAVVLSSNLKPYQEAFDAIQKVLGDDVASFVLGDAEPAIPKSVSVVIAVGGKAALRTYPARTRVIYCLAPGLDLASKGRRNSIRIETEPPLSLLMARFKQVQPALKRLGVLWMSDSMKDCAETGSTPGVEIVSIRLQSSDDLPKELRRLKGNVDAIWLPPDPQLVSGANLATIKSFSWANRIPFYAPTAALVDQGAVAAISSSFDEMGRVAARTAQAVLNGTTVAGTVYPEKMQTTVNPNAAREAGLTIPAALVDAADGVVR